MYVEGERETRHVVDELVLVPETREIFVGYE